MTDETNQPPASGGGVEVRRLAAPTRREIEQLAEIFDLYRARYGEAVDAPQVASWLEGNISSGGVEAFLAEENDRIVGFAITMAVPASLKLGHFWQIRDLFVLPNHRRLGVGSRLLDSIRAAAIATGALRIVLQTEADNTPALRLYAESGYSAVEGYLLIDAAANARFPEELTGYPLLTNANSGSFPNTGPGEPDHLSSVEQWGRTRACSGVGSRPD